MNLNIVELVTSYVAKRKAAAAIEYVNAVMDSAELSLKSTLPVVFSMYREIAVQVATKTEADPAPLLALVHALEACAKHYNVRSIVESAATQLNEVNERIAATTTARITAAVESLS